jgi:hypothetical protein
MAGAIGVPDRGVGITEAEDIEGASSHMEKTIVSAKDCTRSIGFLASMINLLVLASAMVTDIALFEAMLPPTGTSTIVSA